MRTFTASYFNFASIGILPFPWLDCQLLSGPFSVLPLTPHQILHEETFIHAGTDVRSASSRGLLVGIKLDKGTVLMLPKHVGEHATQVDILDGAAAHDIRF